MHGPVPVSTSGGVAKLLKINETHACTLEFWVSTGTLYPPSGWAANLLDWQTAGKEDNFQVGHYYSGAPGNVIFVPQGCNVSMPGMRRCSLALVSAPGYSIRHYLDGTTTTCYLNGQQVGTKQVAWNTEQWKPEALLTLGNIGTISRGATGAPSTW